MKAVIVLLALAGSAAAARAESVTLTVEKATSLEQVLLADFNGNGKETVYKFSAWGLYAMGIDAGRLEVSRKAYTETLKAKTAELSAAHPEDVADGKIKPGSPTEKALQGLMQGLWEAPTEFDLLKIHLEDLNLGPGPGQNAITVRDMETLQPIIVPLDHPVVAETQARRPVVVEQK